MTHVRNDRTGGQRRRAGTTLVLAAATGGLLAAAMAGSPTARADDLTDIVNDVQAATTLGQTDFTGASTGFSLDTTAGTDAGLIYAVLGFDNLFVAPVDYTLLGLTGEATGTDIGAFSDYYLSYTSFFSTTASVDTLDATADNLGASSALSEAEIAFSNSDYFDGVNALLVSGDDSLLAEQATIFASLF
jgi:hypothetical protein